jgi:hypothetical protein
MDFIRCQHIDALPLRALPYQTNIEGSHGFQQEGGLGMTPSAVAYVHPIHDRL